MAMTFLALCIVVACLGVALCDLAASVERADTGEIVPVEFVPVEDPEERVRGLCTEDVVKHGCEIFGESQVVQGLGEQLSLEPQHVKQLLDVLGLKEDLDCKALCPAAAVQIPYILKQAIPYTTEEACVSDTCDEIVVVTPDALMRVGLQDPDDHTENETEMEKIQPAGNLMRHTPSIAQMLRRLLGVGFLVFPALGEASEAGSAEADLAVLASVEFGPNIKQGALGEASEDRHDGYKRYASSAQAWIAHAIRKLGPGRSYVKKWFNLEDAEVDAQIREARSHMSLMLDSFGDLLLKKGMPHLCECAPPGFVLAYMQRYGGCGVRDFMDCGVKEDGRYVVNICEAFWMPGKVPGEARRVRTLVHEASHHFGTGDFGYGRGACLGLSSIDARRNADTYSWLVEELVADRSLDETGSAKRPQLGVDPCYDISSDCDKLEALGHSCTGPAAEWLTMYCRKTCGVCQGGTAGEAPAPPPPCVDRRFSGLVTSKTARQITCDELGALDLSCTGEFAETLKSSCRKTCGVCGGSAPAPPPSCVDHRFAGLKDAKTGHKITCDELGELDLSCTSRFGETLKSNCPKTCGVCGGGPAPADEKKKKTEEIVLEMGDRLKITCERLKGMDGVLVTQDPDRSLYYVADDVTGQVWEFNKDHHQECLVKSKTGIALKKGDWLKITGTAGTKFEKFEGKFGVFLGYKQGEGFQIALPGRVKGRRVKAWLKGAYFVKAFEMGDRLDITCREGNPPGVLVNHWHGIFYVALDATGKIEKLREDEVFGKSCFVRRGTVLKMGDLVKITGTAGTEFKNFEGKVGAWAGYNRGGQCGFNIDFGGPNLPCINGAYLVKEEKAAAEQNIAPAQPMPAGFLSANFASKA